MDSLGLLVLDKTMAFTVSMYRSVSSSSLVGVENFISKNRENFNPIMTVLKGDRDTVIERKEAEEQEAFKRKIFMRYRTDFIKEIRHNKTQ